MPKKKPLLSEIWGFLRLRKNWWVRSTIKKKRNFMYPGLILTLLKILFYSFHYRKPRMTRMLGRRIIVLPGVCAPGSGNFVNWFINTLNINKDKKILEIGCGTGILSIILSKKIKDITCTDLNPVAVKCTKINSILNNSKITVFQSDLFENVKGKFDCVIFNTPFFLILDRERLLKLTWKSYLMDILMVNRFAKQVHSHLRKGGIIFLLLYSGYENVWINALKDFDVKIIARKNIFFKNVLILKAIKQ